MTPYHCSTLTLPLLFLAFLGTASCTSTETGNPLTDRPGDRPPIEGTPIDLHVGLRGGTGGMDTPGVPQPAITALWLQLTEVDFITCSGQSLSTPGLTTKGNLATARALTVTAPDEEICAMVVRTSPLSLSGDAVLPPEAVDQGAFVEGTNSEGTAFSVVVPGRITAVLAPLTPGLTLAQTSGLELKIEDSRLLDALVPVVEGASPSLPNLYNSENAPEVVSSLAQQLSTAFSLERGVGTERQVLAASASNWAEVSDLLCASECALQDRTSCLNSACDRAACTAKLMDPVCGAAFQNALHCRVGLSPDEYTCSSGELEVGATHCADVDSSAGTCGD